jgi:hypothetical protein
MPDRNDDDTNFVRGNRDSIPTKKYPEAASEVSLFKRGKSFSKIWSGVVWRHRLRQSQTSTSEMQYAMDLAEEYSHLFMTNSGRASRSGWQIPIPKHMTTVT